MNSSDTSEIRDIGKNVTIRFGTGVASKVLIFIGSVLFGRCLGPDHYGSLVLAGTVISFFTLLSDPGLNISMPRYLPRARAAGGDPKAYILSGLIIKLALAAVMTAVMLAAADFISSTILKKPELTRFLFVGAPLVIGAAATSFVLATAQGLERWGSEGAERMVENTVYIGAAALAAAFGVLTISLVLKLQYVGAFVGAAAGLLLLSRAGAFAGLTSVNRSELVDRGRELVIFGLPMMGSNLLFFFVSWTDRMFIGRYRDPGEVAYYHLAVLFMTFASFLVEAQRDVLLPVFSKRAGLARLDDEMRERVMQLFRWFTHFSILASIGIYFIIEPFIAVFYGERYMPTVEAVRLILPVFVVRAVSAPIYLPVVGTIGNRSVTVWSQIIWVGVNVALNAVLVPAHGFRGAIIATLMSYVLGRAYTTFECRRRFGVPFPVLLFVKSGVSAAGVVYLLSVWRVHWLPATAIALAAYTAAVFALGEIRRGDVKLIAELLRRKKV